LARQLDTKEVAMRKYLVLALIPMFFAAMACQKSEQPAPESAASPAAEAPAAEASPAAEGEAAPPAGAPAEASPAASPAAP
jgi:hypothetical protein